MKNKKINPVPKEKWVWMPHAGHLCVSSWCRFKLNTKVGGYIVSTVGEYWPERGVREIHAKIHDLKWFNKNRLLLGDYFDAAYMKRFGFEEIGYGRTYETMVFLASKSKDRCCPYSMRTPANIDFQGYSTAEEAYKGHLKLCKKWATKA